jgi:Na+-driven multidrug efflux pump
MYAKGEIDELKRTFSKFEWIMHTVSTLMFTITGILAVPFVQVYTSGLKDADIYIVPAFSMILCFALAARCIQMPYNVMVQAAGHFKETQNSAIIEPIINVVISCVMVYRYGLIGVAIGTLVSMVYRVFYLAIYLMKNILHIKPVDFIKQLFVDLISVFVMVVATKWISLIAISYTKWIIMAVEVSFICIVCVILVNALFYPKFLFSQPERLGRKINRK